MSLARTSSKLKYSGSLYLYNKQKKTAVELSLKWSDNQKVILIFCFIFGEKNLAGKKFAAKFFFDFPISIPIPVSISIYFCFFEKLFK